MSKFSDDLMSRRRLLARIALGAGLAYVAPVVAGLDMAHASGASRGSSGGYSRGSRPSRPSRGSRPSRPSRGSRSSRPSRGSYRYDQQFPRWLIDSFNRS